MLLIIASFSFSRAKTRTSTIGSNPYMSYVMFPQDIRFWHSNYLSNELQFQKRPYWGDIDQPLNRPNGTYTSTGLDYENGSTKFSHGANIYSADNNFSYTHRFSEDFIANSSIFYGIDNRYSFAKGTLTDNGGNPIPFEYSHAHLLNTLKLNTIASFNLFDRPVGLNIRAGFENTLLYLHDFEFTKASIDYSTDRALWGWTTSACAHIFGAQGVQGDSWLQNGYVMGPIFELDIQGGVDLNKARVGTLLFYRNGHQDSYRWNTDSTSSIQDATLKQNFAGSYKKENWSSIYKDLESKFYGNFNLSGNNRYSLNTFLLAGYHGSERGQALSSNLEISNNSKDNTYGFTLECSPNLLIPMGSIFSYINVLINTEYVYTRFNNTSMRWLNGGQVKAYRNTETSNSDENSWQGFSYANQNNFGVGLDISTMFPIIQDSKQNLGFGFEFQLSSDLTYLTKYYGQNIENGSKLDFDVSKRRYDYERETLFGTSVKVQYEKKPYLAWLELREPFLHSILPRTKVTDADGKQEFYIHEKSPLWMSFEGIEVRVFVAWDYTIPFLR